MGRAKGVWRCAREGGEERKHRGGSGMPRHARFDDKRRWSLQAPAMDFVSPAASLSGEKREERGELGL
jgi:hypothetical protein